VQRLGRNAGGYFGEVIDIDRVLAGCREAAVRHEWTIEDLQPEALHRIALRRPSKSPDRPNLYISAGMHGDEPASPLAALRLLEENLWPDANLWLVPVINPVGYRRNTRENGDRVDVNRDYRNPATAEAKGHIDWLLPQPLFHLTLLLHEDWESNGFYCYELHRPEAESFAEAMVEAVRAVCPIETETVVDGREVHVPGIIRPRHAPADRPDWPEALWLGVHKTGLSYTLEAPSDWPIPVRVEALITAVRTAVFGMARQYEGRPADHRAIRPAIELTS